MESIKLKQFIYLCGTSFACSLIFGLIVHENWKDTGKMTVAAVVSSVAGFWVVKREDLQEKFENGLVEASSQVKSSIDKVKNKIQGRETSYSTPKAIASEPSRKALPDRQTSEQTLNPVPDRDMLPGTVQNFTPERPDPVAYQNVPPETSGSNLPGDLNPIQQQSEPEYNSLVGQLQQLQEKNTGLQSQLHELQEQNNNLQSKLELSDRQRQEWNEALESLDEQSQLLTSPPSGEQVGLEDLLDQVPSLEKQQLPEEDLGNSADKENKFDEALNQFSQTLQTPDKPIQIPPQQQKNTSLLQEELEELPNELADELEDIVGEPSAIKSSISESEELEELPSELADELENMVIEEPQPQNKSPLQPDELDLISQLSQDLQLSDGDRNPLTSTEGKKSILSEEQAELEQLFGQTPDRTDSDRNKQ